MLSSGARKGLVLFLALLAEGSAKSLRKQAKQGKVQLSQDPESSYADGSILSDGYLFKHEVLVLVSGFVLLINYHQNNEFVKKCFPDK